MIIIMIYMVTPKNDEKLYINREFIEGKYKELHHGTKLFYTYCLYLQNIVKNYRKLDY